MKTMKLILCAGIFVFGFALQGFSQIVMPEIEVRAMNYKYLNALDGTESPVPATMLEKYAAAYDPTVSDYYEDEYDSYFISFIIPEGKILAVYDKQGKLKRTAEKYKDVDVPKSISTAVAKKFPNWAITKDVYLVTYHEDMGVTKQYKLVLENDKYRMKVKMNDKGEFL